MGGGKTLSNKYLRLCVALPWLSVDVSVCGFIYPLKKCFILRAKLMKFINKKQYLFFAKQIYYLLRLV